MIRRPPRSTRKESSAASDVYKRQVTTGASSDIEQATQRARAMVMQAGLSKELGPVAYGSNEEEVFLGRSVARTQNMSEETSKKVDSEIRKIVDKGYERARTVLTAVSYTHLTLPTTPYV